jgi:hypothetical protein
MDNGKEMQRKQIIVKFLEELNEAYSNPNPSVYRSCLEVILYTDSAIIRLF